MINRPDTVNRLDQLLKVLGFKSGLHPVTPARGLIKEKTCKVLSLVLPHIWFTQASTNTDGPPFTC